MGQFFNTLSGLIVLIISLSIAFYITRSVLKLLGRNGIGQDSLQPTGDAMRFALASTLLAGQSFRKRVIKTTENPYQATAPEIGISSEEIVTLAKTFTKRSLKYSMVFIGLLIIFMIFSTIDPYGRNGFLSLLSFGTLVGLVYAILRKDGEEKFKLITPYMRENYTSKNSGMALGEHDNNGEGRVLCYGNRYPFTGLGNKIADWTITVDVMRPAEKGGKALKVNTVDIYKVVEKAVKGLKLDNIKDDNFIFVAGTEVNLIPSISPFQGDDALNKKSIAAPKQVMPKADVTEALLGQNEHTRGYRVYHIIGWGGEIVFTYMLRATRTGNAVSIETIQLLLPPVSEQFRTVDSLPRHNLFSKIIWGIDTLGSMPFVLIKAALELAFAFVEKVSSLFFSKTKKEQKHILRQPDYNFGYKNSIREIISATNFNSAFQSFDASRYRQTLDQQILSSVADYLEGKKIDISTFTNQTNVIQNNSVSLSAQGNIDLQGVAIGKGAKSVSKVIKQAIPSAKI